MKGDMLQILSILGIGGILAGILGAILNYIFHRLSLRRQFCHALDQKMIERISDLVEGYYGHISSSSQSLHDLLIDTLPVIREGGDVDPYRKTSFYHVLTYYHHLERLTQQRPVPLFTEIKAEVNYVSEINQVYDPLPFGFYDISFLLSRFRIREKPMPAHDFLDLIDSDPNLLHCYEVFSDWLGRCHCVDSIDPDCKVHKVIEACDQICEILDDQIKKMYSIWYDRCRKKPKKREQV
jgi:hypothetical protein